MEAGDGLRVQTYGRVNGYPVELEFHLRRLTPGALGRVFRRLELGGFERPALEYQRDADGLPMCPRHGSAMALRERQGDTWHSHRVLTNQGQELYCRGRAGHDSPGWYVAPGDVEGAAAGE
jgi:hypothetical protein